MFKKFRGIIKVISCLSAISCAEASSIKEVLLGCLKVPRVPLRNLATQANSLAVLSEIHTSHLGEKLSTWKNLEIQGLTPHKLEELFKNQIPAIRVRNFLSVSQCERLVSAAEQLGFDYYENVTPPIGRIGITQFESSQKEPETYFDKVKEACAKRDEVYSAAGTDVLESVIKVVRSVSSLQAGVAHDSLRGEYFAGLIRQINQAHLHFDFAKFDAPGWHISGVEQQLSWNIYVSIPQRGGELVVHELPWEEEIYEKFLLPGHSGSYGFEKELVSNVRRVDITPEIGDLVVFNTRNFHEVKTGEGKRISISSFFGKHSNGKIVFWS